MLIPEQVQHWSLSPHTTVTFQHAKQESAAGEVQQLKFVGREKIKMAGLVKMAIDRYVTVVDRISDPRVNEWPLMSSPVPTILMVLAYLYIVVILGPRIMANRKPFKLRSVLIAYNGFQVIFSSIMLWEHLMSGWLTNYSYKCQPVDYSHNQEALRMVNLCWWYYISKLSEFADTIFFVLRKKDSQVTFLHLYHHSLTPIETWVLVKFIADCGYPKIIAAFLLFHSVVFFALFSNFYYQTYKARQRARALKKD
ncbi:uncharacterized protein CBL_00191 [Carabus blaptoides fortunei]